MEPGQDEVRYEKRVIAYVDVLGFTARIRASRRYPSVIDLIHRGLARLSCERGRPFQVSTFSDHIACSIPDSSDDVERLFHAVADFSAAMVADFGMILRGAITTGDLVHDQQVIFGPALVRAYEIEQHEAIYPRVVLDEKVVAVPEALRDGFMSGEDRIPYVNLFWPGWDLTCNRAGNAELRLTYLINVRNHVSEQLVYDLPSKDHAKLRWFAAHFDRQMEVYGHPDVPLIGP